MSVALPEESYSVVGTQLYYGNGTDSANITNVMGDVKAFGKTPEEVVRTYETMRVNKISGNTTVNKTMTRALGIVDVGVAALTLGPGPAAGNSTYTNTWSTARAQKGVSQYFRFEFRDERGNITANLTFPGAVTKIAPQASGNQEEWEIPIEIQALGGLTLEVAAPPA